MDRGCREIQGKLTEVSGDLSRVSTTEQAHIARCQTCSVAAASERGLARVLAEAVPPADDDARLQVLERVGRAARRRRWLAFVPLAASLILMLFGVAGIGGVPGSSTIPSVPVWCATTWAHLAAQAHVWASLLAAAAATTATLLSPALRIAVAGLSLAGLSAAVLATSRMRRSIAWRHLG